MKKILFVLCIGLMMSCGDSKSNDMCEGIKQTQAIHFENRDELPSDFTGKAFTCKDDKVVLFEFINGSLILEDPFTDGKRNGLNKTWYENGKLMSETEFKNDFRDGFERYWFDNGQLASEIKYKDDELIPASANCWDKYGNQTVCE